MADLIDSTLFIALERRRQRLDALAAAAPDGAIALASITASELLAGVYRADSPERRLRREAFVEAVLSAVPVLPFDLPVARLHARLWTTLAATGQPIGAHDLIMAATALANGYGVLTDNVRHFQRVPGLMVRQPAW